MSSELPNREQALGLLRKYKCSPQVISHCLAVADLAVETAGKLEEKGHKIDIDLVEAGALLHDLGRSKTHGVDHGVVGAKLAESAGLPFLSFNSDLPEASLMTTVSSMSLRILVLLFWTSPVTWKSPEESV